MIRDCDIEKSRCVSVYLLTKIEKEGNYLERVDGDGFLRCEEWRSEQEVQIDPLQSRQIGILGQLETNEKRPIIGVLTRPILY